MNLKRYLEDNSIAMSAFAHEMGVPVPTVWLWAEGKRIPRREKMIEIAAWSNYQVLPNDFYGVEAPIKPVSSKEPVRGRGFSGPPPAHQMDLFGEAA